VIRIDTNNRSNDGGIIFDGVIAGGSNNLVLDSGGVDISVSGAIASVGRLTLTSGANGTISGDVDVAALSIDSNVGNVTFSGNG
jgi:hypothetical protein